MNVIRIYTTSTCPYCHLEKEYLDSKKVSYQEIQIDHNRAAAQEMLQKSGQLGVPFTVIKKENGTETTILGFDQKKLDQTLGI